MPILDLLATAAMLSIHFGILSGKPVFPFAMYLITKGVAFRKDAASVVDFIIGLYIIGMIVFDFHTFLVYIFAVYLIQKAVFSFF
tara:strand:+ start:511 stop:765 length:255 start_codon:yes stop_codon:yes gene_type:complete